jgi:hypothetical protein
MYRCVFLVLSILLPAQAQLFAQDSLKVKALGTLEAYLNMEGTKTAADFQPETQGEKADKYLKSLVNPWGAVKVAFSSGLDQWRNKPEEWRQGWDAYGKRAANIEGQYAVQKTVTYLISAPLHEDNRYFGSGKHSFWPRIQYALLSSILARHDDGKSYVSVSQLGGVAAGAFVARAWLPPSQSSAGDAAVSFGISMLNNAGVALAKEFLPDLLRRTYRKRSPQSSATAMPSGVQSTKPH